MRLGREGGGAGHREVGVLCDGKGGMVSLDDISGQTRRQVGNQQDS